MALNIEDRGVDKLVAELIALKRTSKLKAVKAALKHEIASHRRNLPIRERLAKSLAMAYRAAVKLRPMKYGVEINASKRMWRRFL